MSVEPWERRSLALLLVIALLARIIGLGAGLWYDEILTLTQFIREPWGDLLGDFSSLNNHMFYSVQAKVAIALFGESAAVIRLPALLFGMGSLVVLWLLGREAAGRIEALLAVGLMAISYHHVWFSQNARGYTGLLFWTSLATLLLIKGLKKPSWSVWTGYGLCVAAAMYTHLSAGFFFAAHALVYAVAWLRGARDIRGVYGFGLGGIVTALLHAPLFAQVWRAMQQVSLGKTSSAMAVWTNPMRTLQEITASLGSLDALAPLALAAALLLIGVGMAALLRRGPVLLWVYALSIPVALLLLLALDFRIWPRYFFVDIGFVFLCVATGAVRLCDWFSELLRHQALGIPLLVTGSAAMIAASLFLLERNYTLPKQDFAGALALIERSRVPGDTATSLGLASEPIHSYFKPDWPVLHNAADLHAMPGAVWVVTAFDDHVLADQTALMGQIKREFILAGEFEGTLGGGIIKVYHRRLP